MDLLDIDRVVSDCHSRPCGGSGERPPQFQDQGRGGLETVRPVCLSGLRAYFRSYVSVTADAGSMLIELLIFS